MNLQKLSKTLSFLVLFTSAGLFLSCGEREKAREPGSPYTQPALNETKTATLQRRSVDNYAQTCLFLNDSFKKMNAASICVQTDLSLTGAQVTDQKAEFRRLQAPSSLTEFSLERSAKEGENIAKNDYRAGDVFYFKKSDTHVAYDLVFEIESVQADSVSLKYQVKSFQFLK